MLCTDIDIMDDGSDIILARKLSCDVACMLFPYGPILASQQSGPQYVAQHAIPALDLEGHISFNTTVAL
jgi:hypothetical protein